VDSALCELVWSPAELVTAFIQREPQEGVPASERTEVRILFDSLSMYVGVVYYQSNFARHSRQRTETGQRSSERRHF
jgi:hypothetical protein